MFGKKQTKPCPMCTAWLDGANGVAHHLAQNLDFAVVAAADIPALRAHARARGWDKLRLLSAANSSFKYDLGSEDREGGQDSTVSVFTRDAAGTVRHFYTGHPRMSPDIQQRGIDLLTPIWHFMDLTPSRPGELVRQPCLRYSSARRVMKFVTLVWAGLWRKLSRSILILLQVIIAFALFGVLQGLTSGINHAIAATHRRPVVCRQQARSRGFRCPICDPRVAQDGSRRHRGRPPLPVRRELSASRPGRADLGNRLDAFLALYPEDKVDTAQQRAMRQIQDGVIVGIGTMHKYGWKIGQRVTLQSRRSSSARMERATGLSTSSEHGRIAKMTNEDDAQLLITNYRYVNESLPIGPARDTMNLAVLRIADPARATSIEQRIDSQYANSSNETLTQSEHELVQSEVANFGDIDTVAHRIVGAAFFVLLFATGALMMQSIRERTPELAVLKTVGFSDTRVMVLILIETLVLCLAGATVGLLLGTRLLPVAREQIGTVTVPPIVFVIGIACAVVLALAGGSTAAWRGLRLRVADALANR